MYLVFDIGGTNSRIATSIDGKSLTSINIVPTPKDFEQGLKTFKQVVDDLLNGEKIEAIAGGMKGPLNQANSISLNPPDLMGWAGKPLKDELQKAFNIPVTLENDAALAGLGEAINGAGKGYNIVVYFTISTGTGGIKIVNRQIDKSSLGFEVGHQIIDAKSNLQCGCGGFGHLEAFIGGASLERRYGKKAQDISDPQIWDEVAKFLAIGLNNTIVHWSPDIVVLGGNVMKSISIENVKKHLKEFLKIFPILPEIVESKLGDNSGLYGALALINQSSNF